LTLDDETTSVQASTPAALHCLADWGEVANSHEGLRLAVEASAIGVWDVDVATGQRRWSPEFRAALGLDASAPADPAVFTALLHPQDRDWVVERYAQLYSPDAPDGYDLECRILRADTGELRWVAMKGRAIRDAAGRVVRGLGTLTDVTERKTAERTLRFQALLLERMTEGVSLSSEDGTIVYTNAAEDVLFGYAPGELIGQHVSVQNAYPPEENARIVTQVMEASKAGGVWEGEWRNRRKDGSEFFTASRITTVEIEGRLHFLCVQRDVTAERAAREREQLLSREVDHRARNALAVVQSLVRLTPFVSREQFTQTLTGRINAMARVHTLLSRNAWRGATVRELVCAELAPFEAEGKTVIEGPEVSLRLEAAQSLSLLIHELTTNAGKYGALSTIGGQLEVRWSVAGSGELELEWTERGGPPGVEPERAGFGSKLINGAASQLAGSLTRRWEPEGLICRLRVGRGFLTREPGSRPAPGARPASTGSLSGRRVLIVEDETLLALELAEELQRAGAVVVETAHTLEQGLLLAVTAEFDCAVLDANLGGVSVAPLASLISDRGFPFVLVTGYESPDIVAPALLQKPVDHAALRAALAAQFDATNTGLA
jgi:PAS domain S-box-containing protein